MKRLLIVATLIAASTLLFGQMTRTSANQKGNDEQAVRQVLDELYAALGRNDAAALDRIYSDDYTFINESGEFTTKAPRLAAIKSGEMKYESLSFEDMNVRLYGNTAVATYRATVKARSKGQDVGGTLRVTVTLVKTKGRWQVVAAQATRTTA
jgi:uncharacterized protein (TIGR02246 family)